MLCALYRFLLVCCIALAYLQAEQTPLRLHIESDRPIYHMGDVVLMRLISVDAFSRAPQSAQSLRVEILDPRENRLTQTITQSASGISGMRWQTSGLTHGGTYTVRVRPASGPKDVWSSRSFHIADHRRQEVAASIHFTQYSVAPGEYLRFITQTSPLSDGSAQPTRLRVSAVVDGRSIFNASWDINDLSDQVHRLKIPSSVQIGGSLALTVEDDRGGSTTIARSLPIVVQGVQMETRIPGGGLVAGLETRVYAQARLPDGRPASFQARIIDDQGSVMGQIESLHEGRGRSDFFVPQEGASYRLQVDVPGGIEDIQLPTVQNTGVSLHAHSDALPANQDIHLRVAASPRQELTLQLRRAGVLVHLQHLEVGPENKDVRIPALQGDGVLDVEIRDAENEILAERRIFRHPSPGLQLRVVDMPRHLRAGANTTLTLEVRDDQGLLVPDALVSLRLRDAGISKLRTQRDRHPSFTSMLLLEQEVLELKDPEVYLLGDACSDLKLDLLLSCQGLAVVPMADDILHEEGLEAIAMQGRDLGKGFSGRQPEPQSGEHRGGSGAFMAIGAGGGAAGIFAHRNGGGRRRALGIAGGSRASESAVIAALRLFARIDQPENYWRVGEVPVPAHLSSIPGTSLRMPEGVEQGWEADLALTALITHTFLCSGYDHRTPNQFRIRVAAAIDWLVEQAEEILAQEVDAVDSVLIARLAVPIIEAFAMTMDMRLRHPAQALVHRLLSQQLLWQDRWLGWGSWQEVDGERFPVVDFTHSLEVALALQSALAAGLDISLPRQKPRGLSTDSLEALKSCLLAAVHEGRLAQRWSPARDISSPDLEAWTALRLAALLNLTDLRQAWVDAVALSDLPEQEMIHLRHLLWASEGLFLFGAALWPNWNDRLRDPLIQRQQRGYQVWDGLWDIPGPIHQELGPLASTALAANTLQVYYRYLPHDWRQMSSLWRKSQSLDRRQLFQGSLRSQGRDTTWLWAVALRSNQQGQISLQMPTAGAHGNWELSADVLDQEGRMGQLQHRLQIRKALSISLRHPPRMLVGDSINSQLLIHGSAGQEVRLRSPSLFLPHWVTLNEDGIASVPVQLQAESLAGVDLRIDAEERAYRDQIRRHIPVIQPEIPWHHVVNGLLLAQEDGQPGLQKTWNIPLSTRNLKAQLQLPMPISERARSSHAALLRIPHGCFEQTSATTYPLALAHNAISQQTTEDPSTLITSRDALQQGYQRLLSFECSAGGFEWFGRGAGHTGLTAFGLGQFYALAQAGIAVDQNMLLRTENWLLQRIDPISGAVEASGQRSQHNWDKSGPLLDWYVAWALASSARDVPVSLLQRLKELPLEGDWQHSLAAETWLLLGHRERARQTLSAISWDQDNLVKDPGNGVIRSNARSLRIESSARALICALALGDESEDWQGVYHALLEQQNRGRFGSTQATVQVLRALALWEQNKDFDLEGTLTLKHQDGLVQEIPVGRQSPHRITIEGLQLGSNSLSLSWQGNRPLNWSLELSAYQEHPDNPPDAPLQMALEIPAQQVRLGDAVDLQLAIIVQRDTPTPMARIGLPSGLLIRPDQLDELVEAGHIAAWETHNGEVVLYWRELLEGRYRLNLATVADVAGQFRGLASSIQPYYQEELRYWHRGLSLDIEP